jgi:hypothetical protein
MATKYTRAQHKQYLEMSDTNGRSWLDVFRGDTDFYSAAYWDLLTEIWRADKPVRKTDALRYMKAIKSAHTASKYVEFAIKRGFLLETDNPEDARSKLLSLSDEMRARLDQFFDTAIGNLRQTSQDIAEMGHVPDDH